MPDRIGLGGCFHVNLVDESSPKRVKVAKSGNNAFLTKSRIWKNYIIP
jgi:hypothetical protein